MESILADILVSAVMPSNLFHWLFFSYLRKHRKIPNISTGFNWIISKTFLVVLYIGTGNFVWLRVFSCFVRFLVRKKNRHQLRKVYWIISYCFFIFFFKQEELIKLKTNDCDYSRRCTGRFWKARFVDVTDMCGHYSTLWVTFETFWLISFNWPMAIKHQLPDLQAKDTPNLATHSHPFIMWETGISSSYMCQTVHWHPHHNRHVYQNIISEVATLLTDAFSRSAPPRLQEFSFWRKLHDAAITVAK